MATKIHPNRAERASHIPKVRSRVHKAETAADLIRNIAESMERMPEETWTGIPTDASKNVDHYLYGSSKQK